ncbi:hypothetical protein FACS18949_04660 [Clostridia bacterium]|nr:hypothetical protein FACS189425_07470 [Clostridia bacterium]GHV32748.1 hypothetical protein FACS18949_04660 [Clostridia bacterium]
MTLGKNERLVYVGETALRAPDGGLLPAVPQYMIVPADNADPSAVVTLQENERLVMAGTVHNRKTPSDVKTLYIKENAENVNASTGLSKAEERACDAIIPYWAAALQRSSPTTRTQKRTKTG